MFTNLTSTAHLRYYHERITSFSSAPQIVWIARQSQFRRCLPVDHQQRHHRQGCCRWERLVDQPAHSATRGSSFPVKSSIVAVVWVSKSSARKTEREVQDIDLESVGLLEKVSSLCYKTLDSSCVIMYLQGSEKLRHLNKINPLTQKDRGK